MLAIIALLFVPYWAGSQSNTVLPADFAIHFEFGLCWRDVVDTANDRYVRDLATGSGATRRVPLRLSDSQRRQLNAWVDESGFFDLPVKLHSAVVKDGVGGPIHFPSAKYLIDGWQLLSVPQDVKPWTLLLWPTGTIRGRLIPERGGIKLTDAIMVGPLFIVDGEEARGWNLKGFRVAIDGSFAIDGLYGTQRIRVDGLPSGWKVRSITRGRTNVEAGIDVESGETIDVVITIGQQ